MPSTPVEAMKIVGLINRYLPYDKAKAIAHDLNELVGKPSENVSLKMTMQMLEDLYTLPAMTRLEDWHRLATMMGYQPDELGLALAERGPEVGDQVLSVNDYYFHVAENLGPLKDGAWLVSLQETSEKKSVAYTGEINGCSIWSIVR